MSSGFTEAVQEDKQFADESRYGLKTLLLFLLLTLVYIVLITAAMHRRLWYDELFTLDIAGAHSPSRLMELIHKWDLNPPVSYFLSRWSMDIFGHGKLGVRLPSILEFYTASLFLFAFIRRYAGAGFAAFALALLWQSPQFYYAVEARPYALVLMFLAILLYCWDRATAPGRPTWALVGTFLAAVGLLLSHVFASLAFFAILLAELVRFLRTRRKDVALWAALLVPCAAMLTYIPLFQSYSTVLFPPGIQGSFTQIRSFYELRIWEGSTVIYAVLLALIFSFNSAPKNWLRPTRLEHWALAGYLVCTPIFLNLVLMHGHRAFWPRYCIAASVTIYVVYVFTLATQTRMTSKAAYLAACVVLLAPFFHALTLVRHDSSPRDASALLSIRPELPLVDGYGITFFEMNHSESPQLLSRLYFLKDRPSSVRYEHNTLFEDFEPPDRLDPEFEIKAHVDSYDDFTAKHHQFLVLGTDWNWLLRRLHDEGADMQRIKQVDTPYVDSDVYLVTMKSN